MISRNAQGKPGRTRAVSMSVARAISTGPAAPSAAPAAASPSTRRAPARASPRTDQRRLADLKVKLSDADYMNGAILRIATVLSARLTLR